MTGKRGTCPAEGSFRATKVVLHVLIEPDEVDRINQAAFDAANCEAAPPSSWCHASGAARVPTLDRHDAGPTTRPSGDAVLHTCSLH